MSTHSYEPGDLLCHCPAARDGHQPGTGGCDSAVTPSRVRPFVWTEVGGSYTGDRTSFRLSAIRARGTCPVCRRLYRVRRIETRGIPPGARPGARGPLLAVGLGVVPHTVKGEPCPGAGKAPAETRYAPGRELATWVAVYGSGAVA